MQWNGASSFEFIGKPMETETTTWSEFPNGGKAIAEQILASEEINTKEQDCASHGQGSSRKVNIWVSSFEIEKLWQSSPGLSVLPE